jgi:tetratricopeptide repeat protein 30
MQISMQLDTSKLQGKLLRLQASIKYEEGDVAGTRQFLEQSAQDDPDTIVNYGCLQCHEQKYEDAVRKFQEAISMVGPRPYLSYNMALCHYRLKQYAPALRHIADIIEKGIREHPELSVGMTTEGVEVRSVGNTKVRIFSAGRFEDMHCSNIL